MNGNEQELRRQAELARDVELIATLKNAPRLRPTTLFYFNAFFDLDTERSHGQGLTKIPRSAIVAYAHELDFNEDDTFELVHIIRQVDDAHLERLAANNVFPDA